MPRWNEVLKLDRHGALRARHMRGPSCLHPRWEHVVAPLPRVLVVNLHMVRAQA